MQPTPKPAPSFGPKGNEASDKHGRGSEVSANGLDSPGNIRALKIIVITLGVILVVGFFTVIGRIIYLVTRSAPPSVDAERTSAARPLGPNITLGKSAERTAKVALPEGAEIKNMAVGDGQLVIYFMHPRPARSNAASKSEDHEGDGPQNDGKAAQGIIIVDTKTGSVLQRLELTTNKTPAAP